MTLGDDTRLIHYPVDEGLAGLRAAVARRWPEEAAPLVLRACPPPAAAASQSHEVAVGPGTPADTVADDEALAAALAPWPALGRVPRLAAVRPGTEGEPEHDAGLLEPWILDFVGLVREVRAPFFSNQKKSAARFFLIR